MSDSSSKLEVQLNPGEIVCEKWLVISMLGEGGFGAVYKVANVMTAEEGAMKVESTEEKYAMIKLEVAVLKTITQHASTNRRHVCEYRASGETSAFRFIVMELLGSNLEELRRARPRKRFSNSTTVRLGIQCLEAIEALHRSGFLHRDVKPANFAMGLGAEQRAVFIVDFGLARRYVTDDGRLREQRDSAGFRGTVRYASVNAHAKVDVGRRDDLWSLLYVLIELRRGSLPWRKIHDKNEVGARKRETSTDQLLDGLPPEFHLILTEIQRLGYSDTPNYYWFYQQLNSVMARKNYRDDDPFDWEIGPNAEHDQAM